MKYLKSVNEDNKVSVKFQQRMKDLKSFSQENLAYLLDRECNLDVLSRYIDTDTDRNICLDIRFESFILWSEISTDLIPFVTILAESYEITNIKIYGNDSNGGFKRSMTTESFINETRVRANTLIKAVSISVKGDNYKAPTMFSKVKSFLGFNESAQKQTIINDVEDLFVDFTDNGGRVSVEHDCDYIDLFHNVEDDFFDVRWVVNLNHTDNRTFKATTISLNGGGVDKDMIEFANDYLSKHGLKFEFVCMFMDTNIQYTKNLDKLNANAHALIIVYSQF